MDDLVYVAAAAAAAFILGGAVTAVVGRRRKRRAQPLQVVPAAPPTPVPDPEITISVRRLEPLVEQHQREGYNAGQAVGLRALQDATKPPPYLALSPPHVVAQRRARPHPHHDMTQMGAPSQRLERRPATGYDPWRPPPEQQTDFDNE